MALPLRFQAALRGGAVRPWALAALCVVGLGCVAAIFFGGDLKLWVAAQRDGGLATLIGRDLVAMRTPVERFVLDRGTVQALTPAAFQDTRPAAGGVFDRLRTGDVMPVAPAKAFEPGSAALPAYALEVGDFTGQRGPDHVIVLRRVREGVCRAFNAEMGKPVSPFDFDPGDRYSRRTGCISDPDTGEFVLFDVFHAS